MRSRFTAYAVGDVRHLMRTTDPEGPHYRTDRGTWAAELRAYCAQTAFIALTILDAHMDGDTGMVHFQATLEHAGRRTIQEERSRFRRRKRRWLYIDGEG